MNIVTVTVSEIDGGIIDVLVFKTNKPQNEICSLDYEPTEYFTKFLYDKYKDLKNYNVDIFYYHNNSIEEI